MEENKVFNGLLHSLKNSGKICYIHHNNKGEVRHLKGVVIKFDDEMVHVRRPLGDEVYVIRNTITSIDVPNMEEEP